MIFFIKELWKRQKYLISINDYLYKIKTKYYEKLEITL